MQLTLYELVQLAKHRLDILQGAPYITKNIQDCIDSLDEVVDEIKQRKLKAKFSILEIKEHGWLWDK